MTAKEFLADKTLQAIEVAAKVIINIVADDIIYPLATDTSHLYVGTPIQRVTDYTQSDDIITWANLTLDLATTNML